MVSSTINSHVMLILSLSINEKRREITLATIIIFNPKVVSQLGIAPVK